MKLVRAKEGYRKVGDKYLLAKKCTKCGRWLVVSTVNFHRAKKGRYGLNSECKECRGKRGKQRYQNNKEKILEQNKQWREINKDKMAEIGKRYYENNKDKIAERHKQWHKANREKELKKSKQYYEANRDKLLERKKQWRKANPEYNKQYREANRKKLLERERQWRKANPEYNKQYYKANKEKEAERRKQWRQTPQGQAAQFNAHNKRRQKEKAQGTGATGDQWLEMMKYFDWRCAYTGERLTKKTKSIDHIVPIAAGGDDMVWNMVPMLRNLNSSKHAKDMLEWYKEQSFYDPKRLQKIYEWQEYAYNKWGKDTEYFNTNDIQIKLI